MEAREIPALRFPLSNRIDKNREQTIPNERQHMVRMSLGEGQSCVIPRGSRCQRVMPRVVTKGEIGRTTQPRVPGMATREPMDLKQPG